MKNWIITLALLVWFAVCVAAAHAAGTCAVATGWPKRAVLHGAGTSVIEYKVDCTADASDGSYPALTIGDVGGCLKEMHFLPGTVTVPTNLMDVTLARGGIDLLGGNGADLSTSANSIVLPYDHDSNINIPCFAGDLVLTHTNNSVNSATLTEYIMLVP